MLPIRGEGLVVERAGRRILDGVDIEIDPARHAGADGPNGAGKSLLARVLAGLVGRRRAVSVGRSRAGSRPGSKIGFVFQRPVLLRRSALANVTYALTVTGVRARTARAGLAALTRARIAHLAETPARVLSGGEQQLLSIARALATEPEILILDEPTSNLDPAATMAIEDADQRGAGNRASASC